MPLTGFRSPRFHRMAGQTGRGRLWCRQSVLEDARKVRRLHDHTGRTERCEQQCCAHLADGGSRFPVHPQDAGRAALSAHSLSADPRLPYPDRPQRTARTEGAHAAHLLSSGCRWRFAGCDRLHPADQALRDRLHRSSCGAGRPGAGTHRCSDRRLRRRVADQGDVSLSLGL